MSSFRTIFMVSGLALAFGSPVFAEEAAAPSGNSAAGNQAPVLPVIPPRLSLPKLKYYVQHPDEYRQFLARLPKRQFRPVPAVPPTAPWQPVTNPAPASGLGNPILLTDGSVIVHQACSGNWYKLTPDITGNYVNGTWSQIAPMPAGYAPLYFASQVLNDGRVSSTAANTTPAAAAPSGPTRARSTTRPPTLGQRVAAERLDDIGDAQSVVLPNGKYMLANCCTTQSALLNSSTLTWTPTGTGKADVNDEEGWTLLQDGTVSTADAYVSTGTCGRNTERYNPATGAWSSDGNSPVQLSDCSGSTHSFEVGPQILRANAPSSRSAASPTARSPGPRS